ncbi:MAG: hypothetical protein A2Y74_07010 [Actinobacteria bacterium RBG_13_63_9]|nr:MAG: hypothetical protein A2Y74_07010 [Actinobacteria bacterium RBG_13_63_9]
MNPAEEMFGRKPGTYLQFNFYVETPSHSPISPTDAYDLQQGLIYWLRSRGYGFDGGAHLGDTWKAGCLQKLEEVTG